jgi:hypothetical protein
MHCSGGLRHGGEGVANGGASFRSIQASGFAVFSIAGVGLVAELG